MSKGWDIFIVRKLLFVMFRLKEESLLKDGVALFG